MPVTALLEITQGPTTNGEAFLGTLAAGAVTLANTDNTDVVAHEFTLLSADHRSALVPGVLGTTPTVMFTPDATGSYRCKVKVTAADGSFDEDIRVFSVAHAGQGYVSPAFQEDTLSGEHNFSAQVRGWAGVAAPKLLDVQIREVSAYLGPLAITPTILTANANDYAPADATDPLLTFSDSALVRVSSDASRNITGLVGTAAIKRKIIVNVGGFPVVLTHDDVASLAANRILIPGAGSLSLAVLNDIATLVYDSVSTRWRVT